MKLIDNNKVIFISTKQEDEMMDEYLRSHFQMDSLDIMELQIAFEKIYEVKLKEG